MTRQSIRIEIQDAGGEMTRVERFIETADDVEVVVHSADGPSHRLDSGDAARMTRNVATLLAIKAAEIHHYRGEVAP